MRTSTGSSLDRQTQRRGPLWQAHPLPVHLWAAVVPKLYCTGRSLKQTRVQTQMYAWMSWLHGSHPPDPDSCRKVLAFIRRAACRTALPTPSPGSRHGAMRKVEIRSSSSTRTVGLCACMWCGTSWTFTGKPPKRSFAENPRHVWRRELVGPIPVSRQSRIVSHQLCIGARGKVS